MREKPSIAVFTNGAALGSIIEMILARDEGVRVTCFQSYEQLAAHMRIAPVDVIICDYEQRGWNAPEMLMNLRQRAPGRLFRSIVLTGHVSHSVRQACRFAQVDEVIIKPMSPLFLQERVDAHMQALDYQEMVAELSETPEHLDNVVPLFGEHPDDRPSPAQH